MLDTSLAHEAANNPAAPQPPRTKLLAIVNAGTSDPSTTRMLADRAAARAVALAHEQGIELRTHLIDLRSLANDIMQAMVTQHISPALEDAIGVLQRADALIASTPVYKAGASGLFTSFFQVLDNDLLIGTPTLLAATAGSERHALVIDDQMRGVFAYLRTITVPTALFATPGDWNDSGFSGRVDRAATELVALISAGFRDSVRGEAWQHYQHSFGSAGGTELEIDLSSDLMQLATGGR